MNVKSNQGLITKKKMIAVTIFVKIKIISHTVENKNIYSTSYTINYITIMLNNFIIFITTRPFNVCTCRPL